MSFDVNQISSRYAWIIAQCRHCSNHMGWKFVATDKKLKPEKFWGLCRSSVLTTSQNEDQDLNTIDI